MKHRREEDKCWIRRVYAKYTPHIQIVGWLIVAAPTVMMCYGVANAALSFDARIESLEQSRIKRDQEIALIGQKLDLVLEFWRIPGRSEVK